MQMSTSGLMACLRLARTQQIGPVTFQKLIKMYKSPETAVEAISVGECKKFNLCPIHEVEKELELASKMGARIVTMFEADYPRALLNIYDPPPVLTLLGNQKLLNESSKVAMVGSRVASTNGRKLAHKLALDLARSGLVMVSGLARGIDSMVHSVVFEKFPTIAVIANGINVVYPQENSHLYRTILQNGGLLITELQFASLPKANLFPQRNRIISGLSVGVVVVEASKRSGSLITANYALSQGKEVLVVPGSALDPKYSGSNHLIKQGATLVESAVDIIDALNFSSSAIETRFRRVTSYTADTTPGSRQRMNDIILQYLDNSPTDIEDLAACTKISISSLLASLMELELLNKIERLPGNKVRSTIA